MKTIKYITALGLLAATSFAAQAADLYRTMQVNLTDGTAVEVSLSGALKAQFTAADMLLTDGTTTDLTVPQTRIKDIKFLNPAGLNSVNADKPECLMVNNTLTFFGLPAGSKVDIWTVDGRAVQSYTAEGTTTVDLNGLAGGIYLVKVNSNTLKISVK